VDDYGSASAKVSNVSGDASGDSSSDVEDML